MQCVQGDVWPQRETGLRQKPSQVMEQSTAETRTMWFSLECWGERDWQLLEGHWKGWQMKPVMGEWHSYQRRKWQMWGIRSNTCWFSVLTEIRAHKCRAPLIPTGLDQPHWGSSPTSTQNVLMSAVNRTLFPLHHGCGYGFGFIFFANFCKE